MKSQAWDHWSTRAWERDVKKKHKKRGGKKAASRKAVKASGSAGPALPSEEQSGAVPLDKVQPERRRKRPLPMPRPLSSFFGAENLMSKPTFVKLVSWYDNNLHLADIFKKGIARAARGYRAVHVSKGNLAGTGVLCAPVEAST